MLKRLPRTSECRFGQRAEFRLEEGEISEADVSCDSTSWDSCRLRVKESDNGVHIVYVVYML